eukprot:3795755-Amphidinium_carterae.2
MDSINHINYAVETSNCQMGLRRCCMAEPILIHSCLRLSGMALASSREPPHQANCTSYSSGGCPS